MTWGNGNVTIEFFNAGNRYEVEITDPDNVSSWVIRELNAAGQVIKNIKAGNGGCNSPVQGSFLSTDMIAVTNQVRVSYIDCQTSPAGEVWIVDPTDAAASPGNKKRGRRLPQGTPLMHDDEDRGDDQKE